MKKKEVSTERPRRLSKYELFADAVSCEWAHQNSVVIHSRMRVLQFESDEVDKSIVAMAASLATLREKRAKLEAQLRGLATVVGKRTTWIERGQK